ncbi:MAG: hypothetical protein MMC33_007768 [Icmadophila ericetorum]|nr:hypothetical protein [Icmadophila ericetorum]
MNIAGLASNSVLMSATLPLTISMLEAMVPVPPVSLSTFRILFTSDILRFCLCRQSRNRPVNPPPPPLLTDNAALNF